MLRSPCALLGHARPGESPLVLAVGCLGSGENVVQSELEAVRRRVASSAGFWVVSIYLHRLGADKRRINWTRLATYT